MIDSIDYNNEYYGFYNSKNTGDSSIDEQQLTPIINELRHYDVYDFLARVSSLNLLIENQNKAVLFDTLIGFILSHKQSDFPGMAKMSSSRFRNLIDSLNNLTLYRMVDPSENAFIERVRYYGNYWIFPGNNYCPSFCLQSFIDVLCLERTDWNVEFKRKTHLLLNFVLGLSNEIVFSLKYGLESIQHIECQKIIVPNASMQREMVDLLSIPFSLLEEKIPDASIHELLFSDFNTQRSNTEIQKEAFYAHPLLRTNDGRIIILNPSILVPFAIHQIILWSEEYGEKTKLISEYNNNVWKKCRKMLYELGHKGLKESVYGITLIDEEAYKEKIMTVGNDQLLFVHYICDDGIGYSDQSMFEHYTMKNDLLNNNFRTNSVLEKLNFKNLEGIYHLFILNSFGRIIQCAVSKEAFGKSIRLSPFELQCISINERDSENFIPKYIKAKIKVTTLPPALIGELNYLEIYKNENCSFYVSDDHDLKNTILVIPPGDGLDYIIRAVRKEDRHLVEYYNHKQLHEVVLNDHIRQIYCTEPSSNNLIRLLVKTRSVNIWITTDSINSVDELNVYASITDALSYWLAEIRTVIESTDFIDNTIRINIQLQSPIVDYYLQQEICNSFIDSIYFNQFENSIQMVWTPVAYQIVGDQTGNGEMQMVFSVLKEIEKLAINHFDYSTLDSFFSNPLKKKFQMCEIDKNPLLVPIDSKPKTISEEEENILLDEIGNHFLSLPEYNYGRVPDNKRVELVNSIVEYLYNLLQEEISLIKPDGFFELVCNDLETNMYNSFFLEKRYVYDTNCYPEKIKSFSDEINKTNQASLALRFLAEYIAARPPQGEKLLGLMQYDRLLAICSLIIDWAYKNDLFFYRLINKPIVFLKSGRIGLSNEELTSLSSSIGLVKERHIKAISDPSIGFFSPTKLFESFQDDIEEAFSEEFGFSFHDFTSCVHTLFDYGDSIDREVKRVTRVQAERFIIDTTNLSDDTVKRIIDKISLQQREDYLVPPKPYSKLDVYPWRFNRELSFIKRPVIQYKEDLIWGSRYLYHMWKFLVDSILDGKYKARKPKMKQLIGRISKKRGNDFNSLVASKLRSINGIIVDEKVSKINGKKIKDENNNELGDVDVLYIVPEKKKIVVGEVKNFSLAKNPYETSQEYKRLFIDGEKPCFMTKHKRRVVWIENHLDDVKTHYHLRNEKWTIKSVMFVSDEIVSQELYHKKDKIIVYSNINDRSVKSV